MRSSECGVPALDAAVNPAMAASLAPSGVTSVNPLQVWLYAASLVWLVGVGRSYLPLPLRFEELVAGESWTVEAQMTEFPASAADRLIELLAGGAAAAHRGRRQRGSFVYDL